MFIISPKSSRRTHTTEVLDIRSLKGVWKSLKEGESEKKGCWKHNVSSEIVIRLSKYTVSNFINMNKTVKDSSTCTCLLL